MLKANFKRTDTMSYVAQEYQQKAVDAAERFFFSKFLDADEVWKKAVGGDDDARASWLEAQIAAREAVKEYCGTDVDLVLGFTYELV